MLRSCSLIKLMLRGILLAAFTSVASIRAWQLSTILFSCRESAHWARKQFPGLKREKGQTRLEPFPLWPVRVLLASWPVRWIGVISNV
jgi:hypothetical protein